MDVDDPNDADPNMMRDIQNIFTNLVDSQLLRGGAGGMGGSVSGGAGAGGANATPRNGLCFL